MQDYNCCNGSSLYSEPSIYNGAFIWLLFIIILFRGLPLNNNLFWNGYSNAFSTGTFSSSSIFNKVYPNSMDFNNSKSNLLNNINSDFFRSNLNTFL